MATGETPISEKAGIEVRKLESQDEFRDAVDLQRAIWGFADTDLLPVRLFVVANKIGGHSFGAYEGGRMVGFCLAIPGIKPGDGAYLHSHMLGVADGYRNAGIGKMLKLAQRDEALARGIRVMEWTFDPLEIKNAFFNMERLGAVVKRYVRNQYGVTSSALHGGLPTDRCIAEWHLDSPRVEAVLKGSPLPRPATVAEISVPVVIDELRRTDPAQARAIQAAISDRFDEYFRRDLVVTGVVRTPDSGIYLFSEGELSDAN